MPNMREAYMLSELMDLMSPKSRMMEASFLKNERMVDQAVWGSPSIRLSLAKRGGSSLEAATERGTSFWGSSQEDISSCMVLVVVVIKEGIVDDVVLAGTVVDTGIVVVVIVVVPGGVVVDELMVDASLSSARPNTSVDFALSLREVS